VETALLRFVSFGQIRQAVPHGLVQLTDEHVVLWVPDGTPTRRFSGLPLHEVDDLASSDWSLRETAWRNDTLRITRFGDAHSLWLFWRDGEFMGWYVNLQAPLRPTPLGWDTRDHALDIVVEPDGTWCWKDEDHLAAAVARGRFSEQEARAIRAEGERVIAARPWPTGWEEWRPDPGWPHPELPDGWDIV
jgi:hypothetical protein